MHNLVVFALGRKWCEHHFICIGCDEDLAQPKARFSEWDTKPCCKRCFESLKPDIRKRLNKYASFEAKAGGK